MKPIPGVKVNDVSVFDLKLGMKVLDLESKREGTIVNVKETNHEEIEAFVKMDGDEHVVKARSLRKLVLK